jgi:hypothetical protein
MFNACCHPSGRYLPVGRQESADWFEKSVIMSLMATLVVPIRLVVFILFVFHPTLRALARFLTAAALAVHRADVGGGVFLALFGFGGFRMMIAAARNGDCRSSSEKHEKCHDF